MWFMLAAGARPKETKANLMDCICMCSEVEIRHFPRPFSELAVCSPALSNDVADFAFTTQPNTLKPYEAWACWSARLEISFN